MIDRQSKQTAVYLPICFMKRVYTDCSKFQHRFNQKCVMLHVINIFFSISASVTLMHYLGVHTHERVQESFHT